MIREISRREIAIFESQIEAIRDRIAGIREKMDSDQISVFPANVGTFSHSVREAERFALRIEQAFDRQIMESK